MCSFRAKALKRATMCCVNCVYNWTQPTAAVRLEKIGDLIRCKAANSLILVLGGHRICLVQMFRELPPPFDMWDQGSSLLEQPANSEVKPLVCFKAFCESDTSTCRKPPHGTKLLFHGEWRRGGGAVFSLAFVLMLLPSFPPAFLLHFWLVPTDGRF